MPTVIVDVTATEINSNLLRIAAEQGNEHLTSVVFRDEITTLDELASWLLVQRTRIENKSQFQKRLTIDFHLVNGVRILDSVMAENLPEDEGETNFQALPGWATWTAAEAEAWIDANVVDLDSAKVALKAMADAIVYLRNITID